MARKNEFTEKIDTYIGMKIHELRISMGLSRQQLADKIGVTHQQLQKYEKGTNRISAGRLAAIAKALNKPVAFFFEGVEEDNGDMLPSQHQRMCIEVSRNFLRIKNPMHQNAINLLVRTLSEN
ncbi:MAG: transcriptional regulator [Alphaproteobacteria bacterium CG11_big_fil_rev_8_21_14_0_20_39_49]|nr:MAG: transcriptional regulator [Alphaproteobacteria bacterium CG11_big_fil_rev_8_21_14_0_20_39_49]